LFRNVFVSSALICTPVVATEIQYTATPIAIDGQSEQAWNKAKWQPMPHLMADSLPQPEDFSGRYRLLWNEQYLYLQADITDDVLFDKTANPTERYWEDDCLELFIDSDASGGNHQYNHSAFAYHIALDNQAVDIGEDQKAHIYNQHISSRWQRNEQHPQRITWEVAVKLFDNDYSDANPSPSITLAANQTVGFMLAYCDNDGSPAREHFMGSHKIMPVNGDSNRGWIDASVFGKVTLKK
jgi:hypothetical protein